MLLKHYRPISVRQVERLFSFGAFALALLFAGGCKREEIQVYRVPKDTPAQETQAAPQASPHDQQQPAQSHPQWTVPAGWEVRTPSSAMQLASFAINGKDGQTAMVSVTPLPTIAGHELELINMWRSQVQLAPISKEDAPKQTEPVSIGNEQGLLYDMVSEKPLGGGQPLLRITVAMLARGETSWFFKLTGADSVAREQKPAFLQFLKSIDFNQSVESVAQAPHPVSTNAKLEPQENGGKPVWNAPSSWQVLPPGGALFAKFLIPGENGAKAELNILPAGGGALMNINRWRGQLGLPNATEEELSKEIQSLDVQGGQAMLVDMTGTDPKSGQKARLIGAIMPQGGQTWYYKLMGNEQVVERERDAFKQFLKTIKYEL